MTSRGRSPTKARVMCSRCEPPRTPRGPGLRGHTHTITLRPLCAQFLPSLDRHMIRSVLYVFLRVHVGLPRWRTTWVAGEGLASRRIRVSVE